MGLRWEQLWSEARSVGVGGARGVCTQDASELFRARVSSLDTLFFTCHLLPGVLGERIPGVPGLLQAPVSHPPSHSTSFVSELVWSVQPQATQHTARCVEQGSQGRQGNGESVLREQSPRRPLNAYSVCWLLNVVSAHSSLHVGLVSGFISNSTLKCFALFLRILCIYTSIYDHVYTSNSLKIPRNTSLQHVCVRVFVCGERE